MQEPLEVLKDPTTYGWITYAWVLTLASLGGFVNYVRKVRHGESHSRSIIDFVGDLATSALVGLTTFYFCEGAHISPLYSAALVGISAHMGSRALFQFEILLRRNLRGFIDEDHK